MARLPVPGSDNGQWGDILNSYLSVAHNPDGTLIAAPDIADAKAQASSALANAKQYTDQKIAALPTSSPFPSLPLFNVEAYGAVGDGTTDDYTAIKAAWDAVSASPTGGVLVFPHAKVYRVNAGVAGRLKDAGDGSYALFPFPVIPRDSTHSKLTFGVMGVGDPISPRIFISTSSTAAPVLSGTVLFVDYSSPFSFDNSKGLPSVFGCADVWRGFNAGFSYFNNIHVTIDALTIRQPNDPSLMCLNLASASTASIGKVAFDVTGPLDQSPEPTHPSGGTLLMPKTNNNVTAIVDQVYAWGYYAGPASYTEHGDIRSAIVVRCKIAAPIPWGSWHFAHASSISAEQCPWVISGYDPTAVGDKNAGVVAIPSGNGDATWKIEFLDVESTDYGGRYPWMRTDTVGATVYDPGDTLRGLLFASTNYVEAGEISDKIYVIGASKLNIWGMTNYNSNGATRVTGASPVSTPTQAPGVPTITNVVAGNGQVTVTFTPSSGGGPASSYTVTSTPGNFTVTGSNSPLTLTGLTNGTSYTVTVHATNVIGSSVESASSSPFTPAVSGGTIVASQTFTSAPNGAVPNDDQGHTWIATNYQINNGVLRAINDGVTGPAYVDPGVTGNMSVSVTYPTFGVNNGFDGGPALKISDSNNMIWADVSGNISSTLSANIFSRIGGVNTALGTTYTGSWPTGNSHNLTLSMQSGILTLLLDGNPLVTCNDTTSLTGTGVGMFKFSGIATAMGASQITATSL